MYSEPLIAEEKIAEIRARTDIAALVGQYVRLRRHGSSFRGLCPFHSEKTPSFYVHPLRHFFHCFGCQASGDAIRFLMRIESLAFPEALKTLADRCGLELGELAGPANPAVDAQRQRRDRSLGLLNEVAEFFVRQLHEQPMAKGAWEELERRRITPATAATFRLGLAPAAWDALARHLQQLGIAAAEAESLGLVVAKRGGQGHYDRFRNRLMFPVLDAAGHVIGFSGRALPNSAAAGDTAGGSDQAPPKYINSPESPVYHKGEALFGLHQARVAIRQQGYALLCEGNFDVLALHQAGFAHTAAPLGTAFTATQAQLLRRYTDKVVLMFDGDAAGQKAVLHAQPLLHASGLSGRVVVLPVGEDPDSFLRRHSAKELRQHIESAPSLLEHLIDVAAIDSAGDAAAKAAAIATIGPLLAQVDNAVEVQIYLERIARRFEVRDLDAVRQQLRAGVRLSPERRTASPPNTVPTAKSAALARQKAKVGTVRLSPRRLLEYKLFGILLDQPSLFGTVEAQRLDELLTDSALRNIFRITSRHVLSRDNELSQPVLPLAQGAARATVGTSSAAIDAALLLQQLDEVQASMRNEVDTLAAPTEEANWLRARRWVEGRLALQRHADLATGRDDLRAGLLHLTRLDLQARCAQLKARILAAIHHSDTATAAELSRERHELERQLSNPSSWSTSGNSRTSGGDFASMPVVGAPSVKLQNSQR